jgi:putative oxygen-independent coproporphyrinogen III oxidase
VKKLTPRGRSAKVPARIATEATLGIYVHFPWCLKKCPYCDFLSIAESRDRIPGAAYREAVLRELECRAPRLVAPVVHSVFFGGGTPSLWHAADLGAVLAGIRNRFNCSADVEVTVECNPTSFSERHATDLLEQGVNRISLGVQGLDNERLAFLGRLHDADGGVAAIRQARAAGVANVSADLIYGVYRQDPQQAVREVEEVAALGVQHLSAYTLTIEPGTQFGAQHRKGRLPLLDEDLVAHSYELVDQRLTELGFEHYEISNFAREGRTSRHNLGYWEGKPYLGLGLGAWGTLATDSGALRYRNTVNPERYLALTDWPEATESNAGAGLVHNQVERLTPEQLLSERLMLGLRLKHGVKVAELERATGCELLTASRKRAIERLVSRNRLEFDGECLSIPRSAWLYADGTISELL